MTQQVKPSRRVLFARALALCVCTVWFWQGPIRKAVLEDDREPVWNWVLFRGSGKKVCDLRLFELRDGEEVPIDRPKLLGYENSRDMPRPVRVVRRPKLEAHTRELCRALKKRDGEAVELYGRIRCAGRDEWKEVEDGTRDLCKAHAPAGKKPKARKGKKGKGK